MKQLLNKTKQILIICFVLLAMWRSNFDLIIFTCGIVICALIITEEFIKGKVDKEPHDKSQN